MKKNLKITAVVIASIVMLFVVFGVMDYARAMSGKKPIFTNTASWFVSDNGKESSSYKYSGIGYTVTSCDNESFSFNLGNVNADCLNEEETIIGLSDENKIVATNSCAATYSTDANEADKCIFTILEITFKNDKADYIKLTKAYNNKEDASAEYKYEMWNWSDTYTDPKPQLDNNKLIQEGHISEFLGFQSSFKGLTRLEIEELLRETGEEIN